MDAQTTVNKLCEHLLGKNWYIVDPVSNAQANEIILDEICRKYTAVDETPENKWRRLHKKCKWCHHCKDVREGVEPLPMTSTCLVKDILVTVDNSKHFCTVFELERYNG